MQLTDIFLISAQHPCLTGHFPNHPIVPGVVLLEKVEALLSQQLTNWRITELNTVKFLNTVLPEESIEITIETDQLTSKQSVSFNLYNLKTQTKVATGKITLTPNT